MGIEHFEDFFGGIEDKRRGNRKVHPLINIIFICVVGVMCGMRGFVEIAEFGQARKNYLSKYLDLSHGIPSHDTLGNVLAMIDPEHFAECFERWSQSLRELMSSDIIAMDGKSIRSSFDRPACKMPIHLMSAWSTANRVCLAQARCDTKGNEITALEDLLGKLALDKCVVTADAMHCHKRTTKAIADAGADYVLGLKGNEVRMHARCVEAFAEEAKPVRVTSKETAHGRNETRIVEFVEVDTSKESGFDGWSNVGGFLKTTSCATRNGEPRQDVRYYLTSLRDAGHAARAVRRHWQIENNLHWVLDNVFSEDKSRVRQNNAGENLAYIRKIVLNVLTKHKQLRKSMRAMMFKALMDPNYLDHLLGTF
jgi:predicted transposase YbfD/YdcC